MLYASFHQVIEYSRSITLSLCFVPNSERLLLLLINAWVLLMTCQDMAMNEFNFESFVHRMYNTVQTQVSETMFQSATHCLANGLFLFVVRQNVPLTLEGKQKYSTNGSFTIEGRYDLPISDGFTHQTGRICRARTLFVMIVRVAKRGHKADWAVNRFFKVFWGSFMAAAVYNISVEYIRLVISNKLSTTSKQCK